MNAAPVPVRLQTSVWNPLGDRRALLLHGLGSDSASWWRIASELATQGFMVLAPDLRSHGRSPTAADHRLTALAEDVLLLGDAYDLVVGHSIGGAVAALLLTRPAFSEAAILLDPVLRVDASAREPLRRELHADVGPIDPESLRAREPRWADRDRELKVLAAALVTPGVVDAVLDDNDPWDLGGTVADWRTRVRVLAADPELDAALDPSVLEVLGRRPDVVVDVVAGCGHSIHRERPDVVLATIRTVLEAWGPTTT